MSTTDIVRELAALKAASDLVAQSLTLLSERIGRAQ